MCVFFDMEKSEEPDLLLIFDLAIRLQGDLDLVADTAHVDDDVGRVFVYQSATQVCDHRIPFEDWASTTAMATMLTISRIELPSCRMCTGLFIPSRIGPMASAFPSSESSL